MATTQISDIIVPEVFNPYVTQRTAELSAFAQSGVIVNDSAFDKLASSGGRLLNMPYFNDLTGDSEVLSDTAPLTPAAITAAQDVACLLMRGRAWSVNDLATALSGADPMAAIGDLVAAYWARQEQKIIISALTGAFAAASMSGNVSDISGAVNPADDFTADTFLAAAYKLGDAEGNLTAIAMHSAVFANLRKQNLITTEMDSENRPFSMYMDKRVIVDDGMPEAAGVYTTYLFGAGAIAKGNGAAPVPTETDRDSLGGNDILINRQHMILHPRGIKFLDAAVVGSSPTNAELATAANWLRAYDNKNIKIVQFKHHLG